MDKTTFVNECTGSPKHLQQNNLTQDFIDLSGEHSRSQTSTDNVTQASISSNNGITLVDLTSDSDNESLIMDGYDHESVRRVSKPECRVPKCTMKVSDIARDEGLSIKYPKNKRMRTDNVKSKSAKNASSNDKKSANIVVTPEYKKSPKNQVAGHRRANPQNTCKETKNDIGNLQYKEPLKRGSRQEVVYGASNADHAVKKQADIYCNIPEVGETKCPRDVSEHSHSDIYVKVENATPSEYPIDTGDKERESVRNAKKRKHGSIGTLETINNPTHLIPPPAGMKTPQKMISGKYAETKPPTIMTEKRNAKPGIKFPRKKYSKKRGLVSQPTTVVAEEHVLYGSHKSATTRRKPRQMTVADKIANTETRTVTERSVSTVENKGLPNSMPEARVRYEALAIAFRHLTVPELLSAALVCKLWKDVATHPTLWNDVHVETSEIAEWEKFADILMRRGTQHLYLRKKPANFVANNVWQNFLRAIPRLINLSKLEIICCTGIVAEEAWRSCGHLELFSAELEDWESVSLEYAQNMKSCRELNLKADSVMYLNGDLSGLLQLTELTILSLTKIRDLWKKKLETLQNLVNLESLELGECTDFPAKFGNSFLRKLQKLERLRLEGGQGDCHTLDILEGISQLPKLKQLELINFDIKSGFDKYLATCVQIQKLHLIPTYLSQSPATNNMILNGVTKLCKNLTHLHWSFTQEILKLTKVYVDECQERKEAVVDYVPILKPVPFYNLVDLKFTPDEDIGAMKHNSSNPRIKVMTLQQLKLLIESALPQVSLKISKIPCHDTWKKNF